MRILIVFGVVAFMAACSFALFRLENLDDDKDDNDKEDYKEQIGI